MFFRCQLETVSNREMILQVQKAINQCLTEQERRVIQLRFGLDGSMPLQQREVANLVGISRSYVSQIEKKALEKFRMTINGGKHENLEKILQIISNTFQVGMSF